MHRTRIALLALLCLPLTACFEEPIREHLHLSLRGDGPVVVTVVQKVTPSNDIGDNPELTDRLEESRETIDHSLDPWSQRFALLEPLAEHVSFERPPVDAWNALRSLEGRWISPDLVTAAAAPAADDRQPDPDVLTLASTPRRYFLPPDAAEVESAIVAGLVPEEMLRLVWRPPSTGDDDKDSVDWLTVMANAETSVPD